MLRGFGTCETNIFQAKGWWLSKFNLSETDPNETDEAPVSPPEALVSPSEALVSPMKHLCDGKSESDEAPVSLHKRQSCNP